MFFFEKKNQKTFCPFAPRFNRKGPAQTDESLFASFSTEKEDSSFLASR
jgi:hypothetical protein